MTNQTLRIAFAGTPDFAAHHLACLVENGFKVTGVFTQPDRPAGRGKKVQPTPVKQVATDHAIPVFQPQKLDAEAASQLASLSPDVLIVVAYGIILQEDILQIPRLGCINVHASLLPRWRGAAPIERAILAGDKATGISIMQMDKGLDTGDVLLQLRTAISPSDNAMTVTDRLLELGFQGLSRVLNDLPSYQARAVTQDNSLASYASKLSKEEALIDWQAPAWTIQHQVQAFYPRSPAFFRYRDERMRVISASYLAGDSSELPGTVIEAGKNRLLVACGEGTLEITSLQLPGKKPASLQDIANGHPDLFVQGAVLAASDTQ